MDCLSPKARECALNEVRLLASMRSPAIVEYHEAFFDENLEALCIVMEFAEGGDLRQVLNERQK